MSDGAAMTDDRARQLIDAYLADISGVFPGPGRRRADLLAELRSGLLDAFDSHSASGLPADSAAEAAISEFGDPRELAAAFCPDLTAALSRRLATALALAAAPIGLLWAFAAQASDHGLRHGVSWSAVGLLPVPFTAAAAIICAAVALATAVVTGRAARRLPRLPRIAPAVAAVGGFGTAASDLAILVLLVHQLATAPDQLAPVPVAVATIVTLTRLVMAPRAAHRCLTARSAFAVE